MSWLLVLPNRRLAVAVKQGVEHTDAIIAVMDAAQSKQLGQSEIDKERFSRQSERMAAKADKQ
jgi:hypothetical protein